jgi:exodeoxyribonuclease-3
VRLVTWNCRSGFHYKLEHLARLAPDVAVVVECARQASLDGNAFGSRPTSRVWIGGPNPYKGLAVFGFGSHAVTQADDVLDPSITYALPVRVDGPNSFHLVAVWAHHGLAGRQMATRGPVLQALDAYDGFLRARPAIVAGDFNNHVRWDKPGKAWNHANTVTACGQVGLVSAYHAFHGLDQGDERHPTFYWRSRLPDGPTFHIDYVFLPRASLGLVRSVEVGARAEWIGEHLSDHAPLIVDFEPAFGAPAVSATRAGLDS